MAAPNVGGPPPGGPGAWVSVRSPSGGFNLVPAPIAPLQPVAAGPGAAALAAANARFAVPPPSPSPIAPLPPAVLPPPMDIGIDEQRLAGKRKREGIDYLERGPKMQVPPPLPPMAPPPGPALWLPPPRPEEPPYAILPGWNFHGGRRRRTRRHRRSRSTRGLGARKSRRRHR